MKKIIFLMALCFSAAVTKAQTYNNVTKDGFTIYGNLVNLSNTYPNGVITDTVKDSASVLLNVAGIGQYGGAFYYALPGQGNVDFCVGYTQVSGSSHCWGGIYIEESSDHANWFNVTNKLTSGSYDSVYIDSTKASYFTTIHVPKNNLYYRARVSQFTKGVAKNSYIGYYSYTRNQTVTQTK